MKKQCDTKRKFPTTEPSPNTMRYADHLEKAKKKGVVDPAYEIPTRHRGYISKFDI